MTEVGHRGFIETASGSADKTAEGDKQDSNVMSIDKHKLLELKAKLSATDGEGGPQPLTIHMNVPSTNCPN